MADREIKCRECEGSGKVNKVIHRMFKPPSNNCPTCKGSGRMMLEVEEMCTENTDCDNIDFPNCKITERHYYKSGGYKGIKSCKGFLYRPMTVAEVEECFSIKGWTGDEDDLIMTIMRTTQINYKGKAVWLVPWEAHNG